MDLTGGVLHLREKIDQLADLSKTAVDDHRALSFTNIKRDSDSMKELLKLHSVQVYDLLRHLVIIKRQDLVLTEQEKAEAITQLHTFLERKKMIDFYSYVIAERIPREQDVEVPENVLEFFVEAISTCC